MAVDDWNDGTRHCFGAWLTPASGSALLLIVNGEHGALQFKLPPGKWRVELDSARPAPWSDALLHDACEVADRALVVLVAVGTR